MSIFKTNCNIMHCRQLHTMIILFYYKLFYSFLTIFLEFIVYFQQLFFRLPIKFLKVSAYLNCTRVGVFQGLCMISIVNLLGIVVNKLSTNTIFEISFGETYQPN